MRHLAATMQGTAVRLVLLAAMVPAACGGGEESAPTGPGWPQFHGPRRDNISEETGLLKQWPDGGPKLLWTAEGLGEGFSTVAIAGGLIYTTGNVEQDTRITALALSGRVKWRQANGPAYRRAQAGTRSTPTIDGGRLYHENADGDVACLDAKTGGRIWHVNILRQFDGRNISWGLAESLLVDGNQVVCTPGGEKAGLVALDKLTGRTRWVCTETRDKPGYCSPIVFEHEGVRQIVTLMSESVVSVHAGTGKLLWRVEHKTPFDENISTPIYHDGCVFISTRTTGSRLLRLKRTADGVTVEQVWHTSDLDNQHGGVVLREGYLYGDCLMARPGEFVCLEFQTGKCAWGARGLGRASLTWADGMLYLMNHRRTVALVRPSPKGFEPVSQFQLPAGGRGPSWAHPVVCGGRLYLRHGDFLYCYDVRGR